MQRLIVCLVLLAALPMVLTGCDGTEEVMIEEAAITASQAAPSDAEGLLTAGDAESALGLSGLVAVPREGVGGPTGEWNIVDAAGQVVVTVAVDSLEGWDAWLTDGYSVSETVVPPVGDESFVGPNPDVSPVVQIFAFRKGQAAVILETRLDANGEVLLNVDQLRALAELTAARL